MAERIVLHIGTPKAGTTYLQAILWANRSRLRESGVLVPGQRPFQHNLAADAVRSGWAEGVRATKVWNELHAEALAFSGTVLYSNEWFSLAGPKRAQQAIESFGETPVDVVITTRDLVSVMPAAWQERLKLGLTVGLPEFLAEAPVAHKKYGYWTMDPAWVAHRWAGSIPPERMHIVTVPTSRANPHLLWERFASVAGIPAGAADVDKVARSNESLKLEPVRLLEELGPRLRAAIHADGEGGDKWHAYRWLRRYLSHAVLAEMPGSKIGLGKAGFKAVRSRSLESVAAMRAAGYDIVGDLADLTAAAYDRKDRMPGQVSDREVLDVSMDVILRLLSDLQASSDSGTPVPDTLDFPDIDGS